MCCVMGEPELRSDENIVFRTPGVYVKSIPFEGILTNKRIILVDRATNLLPPREIQLVTIKDAEAGENAIRDQIITLTVMTRAGEKRQMILTFSRQTGGNRIRERDAWLKALKENTSSKFDQVIRKIVPVPGQAPRRSGKVPSPRIEVIQVPGVQNISAPENTPGSKEPEKISPAKKIIEKRPSPVSMNLEKAEYEPSPLQFGTYCSRCGNRVPDGSGYCDRCGSRIIVPGSETTPVISSSGVSEIPAKGAETTIQSIEKDRKTFESFIGPRIDRISDNPRWGGLEEPGILPEQEPDISFPVPAAHEPEPKFEETDEKPDIIPPIIIDSHPSESTSPTSIPQVPRKPWEGFIFKPGKKAVIGIIVVIIIIAIVLGGFFLYPMISNGSGNTPGAGDSNTTAAIPVKTTGTPGIPIKTTITPTGDATSPAAPGNSPANVGF